MTRSHSSRVLSAVGAMRAMTPALLNAASSRPNSATVRSTIAATWASSLDVAPDGDRLVAGGDQLRRRRLHGVFLEVRQDDGRTRLRERPGRREPHAGRGPGDECHLAAEIECVLPSPVSSSCSRRLCRFARHSSSNVTFTLPEPTAAASPAGSSIRPSRV